MSDEKNKSDTLQPSWAAHELFALGLTVVLALWVVVKYGSQTQPADQGSARAEERAAKLAELKTADAEALGSYGVVDADLKRYRLPIADAISLVVKAGIADSSNISKDVVARMEPELELELVKFPKPDFVQDESELDDLELIKKGEALFKDPVKQCANCHLADPSNPASAVGIALKAPQFKGEFWGKERIAYDGFNAETGEKGPLVKVVMDPGYFWDSVNNPLGKVVRSATAPMTVQVMDKNEAKALMAYVRSLSKKE